MNTKKLKKRTLFICAAVVVTILWYNNLRKRHYLTEPALIHPRFSPWRKLLNCGDDNAFIELTGFNHAAFRLLVSVIATADQIHGIQRRGRPSVLDLQDEVGLILFFHNSTLKIKHLCTIFGIVPTVANRIVNKMIGLVVCHLRNHRDAQIKWPNVDEMKYFAWFISIREPTVRDVMGFLDGLAILTECADDPIEQSKYYNGHCKDTTINNVLLFGPDGKVKFACINFPGSMHDSAVSMELIAYLIGKIGIYKVCVDQGFPRGGDLFDIFVGPISKRVMRQVAPNLKALLKERSHKYTSLRQSGEWGMRALQGSFARLKTRLTSNKRKRLDIVHGIILLHNFRTTHIGLNQIATVFNPQYEQYINIAGYDRIRRYYDFDD
jgi:hypothetical protein